MVERLVSRRLMADGMVRRLSTDTFQNFAAKVGIGTNNLSTGNTYGFNPVSRNRTLIEWMYRGSWICGQGVDCIADDMTREWVQINSGAEPNDVEKVYAMMRTMQIPQSFNAMAKWGRLYGGAGNVIMIEGQRLDTPLRLETVKPGQFKGLVTLDRWMLTPDLNSAVKVPGPDFGLPEFYSIDSQTPNMPLPRQRLHYTRFMRMEGVELPFWQKQSENMWGISVLERLYDRLTAFDSATQGAAQQLFRAYYRTLSVENLRDIIAAGGKGFNALVKNIDMIRLYQQNEGFTLLDARDKFEAHQNTFAGQAELINCFGEQLAGALQTPLTRLFGQAPGGLSNTDESGMRIYEDNVNRLQERWFRRPCDVIIPLCAINAKVELKPGWQYEFTSLRQLTEVEQSEINERDANALSTIASTGILPGATILKELRQNGRRTNRWTNITDAVIREAEVNDLVPSPTELGVMPGGGAANASEEGPDAANSEGNPDKVTKGTADMASIIDVQDLPIFIENHMGTIRRGRGWQTVMPAHYGFIEGVGSAEGAFEQLDCFIGPELDASQVYIIDQVNLEGGWDEHKCMIGFPSAAEAKSCYLRAFSDGKGGQRLAHMTTVPMARFKQWLKDGDHTMPAKGQL